MQRKIITAILSMLMVMSLSLGISASDYFFSDVDSDAYYADAVNWAVAEEITVGTSETTFSPNEVCTRGQIVTFLYRLAGEPDVATETLTNPFTDVNSGDYFYDAVLWAVNQGITQGTTSTTFSPDAKCTRGQTVTFLYRYAGSPDISCFNPYTDIASDNYCYTAVLWAQNTGITAGTDYTHFSPDDGCTRGQIVTFLNRHAVKLDVTGVSLNRQHLTVEITKSGTLYATITPINSANRNIIWSTSDSSIATVDNGIVTGTGIGACTITVTTEDGGYTDTCIVTVTEPYVAVTEIGLGTATASVKVGETYTFNFVTIKPSDATDKTLTWTSSDTSVATVIDGTVTAKKTGSCKIYATASNGVQAYCVVTVINPTYAFDKLSAFIMENGTNIDDTIYGIGSDDDDYMFEMWYYAEENKIQLEISDYSSDEYYVYTDVYITRGSTKCSMECYAFFLESDTYIDAYSSASMESITLNKSYEYTFTHCDYSLKSDFTEIFDTDINLNIAIAYLLLPELDIGVTLSDFGFTNFSI